MTAKAHRSDSSRGPGFDFTYTVPLSKNFGFSINAVKFDQFNAVQQIRRTFSTATLATNPLRATVDNPYLQTGNYLLFPITEQRYNLGMRLDWKLSPTDRLSFIHSGSYFEQDIPAFTFNINTGTNPLSWGPDFTHGRPAPGASSPRITRGISRAEQSVSPQLQPSRFAVGFRRQPQLWFLREILSRALVWATRQRLGRNRGSNRRPRRLRYLYARSHHRAQRRRAQSSIRSICAATRSS
jgi:hypothetical protein